ncbi:DUF5316 family protein [Oceanobacillus chungangensis]|uniref:Uncharacterized protein n=1 Tax=Oceanobacillus chungangensis TaxID=1229152 RepID=A0A3D8PIC8_9BACI|nr:DUF5316 family protein [Oceanobacillus chungangensis]RDW14989.1 hypothetical protein CWR45_19215 [Oceanobacillus chungangensis]
MLKFFLIIGGIGILISAIFLGVMTDGQQQRANFHSETEEHRSFRTKIASYAGLIGIASLGIAALIYYL